jgi:hypothetical protein
MDAIEADRTATSLSLDDNSRSARSRVSNTRSNSGLSSSSSSSWENALRYYEENLVYLCQAGSGDDHLLQFLMSLANNTSHVYSCLGNIPRTRQTMSWFQNLAQEVRASGRNEEQDHYYYYSDHVDLLSFSE